MPFTSGNKLFNWKHVLCGLAVIGVLILCRIYSYILFHTTVEIISVIIAVGIFMFAWNSRRIAENDFILFLGIAFLFIAIIDVLHAYSYFGMELFRGYGKNLPIQLLVISRYFQAVSVLLSIRYISKKLNVPVVFTAFFAVSIIIIPMPFSGFFPSCFEDGKGLTVFKISSEYIICMIFLTALYFLYKRRKSLDARVYNLLVHNIFATILSGLAFTLYNDVYGLINMLGHIFKITAYYFLYEAIIEKGFREPYSLLFRNLKAREQDLTKMLEEVKSLEGIIPICSSCKKIRDDSGYWQQVEEYIRRHSDAEFTHSICPECAEKLYSKVLK
jgi:hypothetical protein